MRPKACFAKPANQEVQRKKREQDSRRTGEKETSAKAMPTRKEGARPQIVPVPGDLRSPSERICSIY